LANFGIYFFDAEDEGNTNMCVYLDISVYKLHRQFNVQLALLKYISGDQALKTHPLLNALSFTKFHCAVTKRKEEESTLTSIYDVNRMEHAQEYLAKHIDGESIVDDDIVNWVTVGFLHVPTTEDMPMTVKVETGFMLRPFNFFDRTASFDMPEHAETKDGIIRESEPSYEQCSEPKKEYCRFC
jgi:Cu2+-containing amine oxidase